VEAETQANVEVGTLGETLVEGDDDAGALSDALGKVEAKTLGETLVEGDADADTLAETLGEV